jgi:hypothetical protein
MIELYGLALSKNLSQPFVISQILIVTIIKHRKAHKKLFMKRGNFFTSYRGSSALHECFWSIHAMAHVQTLKFIDFGGNF